MYVILTTIEKTSVFSIVVRISDEIDAMDLHCIDFIGYPTCYQIVPCSVHVIALNLATGCRLTSVQWFNERRLVVGPRRVARSRAPTLGSGARASPAKRPRRHQYATEHRITTFSTFLPTTGEMSAIDTFITIYVIYYICRCMPIQLQILFC